MNTEILDRGAVLTFGLPRRGFWEEVKIGRYKVYIEYLYAVEEPHMREVLVDVYRARGKRWRLVRTWKAGEVCTSPIKIRARVGRGALQRLDDIKDALLRHVLERVQEHNQ